MIFPFPLLVDQNLPAPVIDDLRRSGHDVRSPSDEGLSGADAVVESRWDALLQWGRV